MAKSMRKFTVYLKRPYSVETWLGETLAANAKEACEDWALSYGQHAASDLIARRGHGRESRNAS